QPGGGGQTARVSQQVLVPFPEVAHLRRRSGALLVIHGGIRLSAGRCPGGPFATRSRLRNADGWSRPARRHAPPNQRRGGLTVRRVTGTNPDNPLHVGLWGASLYCHVDTMSSGDVPRACPP